MIILCTNDVQNPTGEVVFSQGQMYKAKATYKPIGEHPFQQVIVGITNQRKEFVVKTCHPQESDNFFDHHFKEIDKQEELKRKNLQFLALLNHLPILQHQGDKFIYVADTPIARSILKRKVPDLSNYLSLHMNNDQINIATAGFKYGDATHHNGKEFIMTLPFQKAYTLFQQGTSKEWVIQLDDRHREILRFKREQNGQMLVKKQQEIKVMPNHEFHLPFSALEQGRWAMTLEVNDQELHPITV